MRALSPRKNVGSNQKRRSVRSAGNIEHDVGDEKAVLEDLAFDVQAELAADGAARAVGHHQPVAVQRVGAVGRFHLQSGAAGIGRDLRDAVAPAQFDVRLRGGALHQVLFQPVLLQVHHARAAVAGLGLQVEAEDLALAVEGAAHVPRDALVDDALAEARAMPAHIAAIAAEAVEDLQRALGVAHAARADADRLVLVQHQHRQAALRAIERRSQAHRPRTHHHQRHAARAGLAQLRRLRIFVLRVRVGPEHCHLLRARCAQPSSAFHISTSRSAVQMRGSRCAVASS